MTCLKKLYYYESMVVTCGAVLIEKNEIIMHIYGVDEHGHQNLLDSKRRAYQPEKKTADSDAITILQTIADFLDEGSSYHIVDWKICARGTSADTLTDIAQATGLKVELLDPRREQELLLRGMTTELI